MPRPNKRKKQLAAVQDGIGKRRKASKLREEWLSVPKEDSSPIEAIVGPDTISSLHANTALPDVVTSLPPADVDVGDGTNPNANTDSETDTQSNNHQRATDPSMSTSTLDIKLEPAPAPAPTNTSTDQVETSIPTEPVINGSNLNRTVTVRRKAAKRTDPLYLVPPPPNIAAPLPPSPQAEEIPARKKPRVEEPLPTATDEAARKTASPDISEILPTSDTPPRTPPVNASTRRRSRRQIQLEPIETSEVQLGADADLSAPVLPPPPPATANAPTRRRSSRHVIPTSGTGSPVPPPSTATVDASIRRQSRRQTPFLPASDTSDEQLDDTNDDDDDANGDDADLPGTSSWKDRLGELTDYHRIQGNCNVTKNYSENTKLGKWVGTQRHQYRLHRDGRKSHLTTFRIKELERLGFEWDIHGAAWEERLSELADYRKIQGNCNVPRNYSENTKLGLWVANQRTNYRWHVQGKTSPMTLPRIKELERLGFEWDIHGAAWEDRLSELADYRKIQGNCNVPRIYSKNTKLGKWVGTQRCEYKLYRDGNKSNMTLSRVKTLESLGFEWDCYGAAWKDSLNELADFSKRHRHCNVPYNYSENTKLANWVDKQRSCYKLYRDGKKSPMTSFRVQRLESMGFQWDRKPQLATATTSSRVLRGSR
jgi:hypothetical protein